MTAQNQKTYIKHIIRPLIREEFKEVEQKINDRLDNIQKNITDNRNLCTESSSEMRSSLSKIEQRINEIERDNRKKFLRTVGLPTPTGEGIITLEAKKMAMVECFVKLCNDCGMEGLEQDNIVSSTIVKNPSDQQSVALITEFKSEGYIASVYAQRTMLKNCKERVYINECLSRTDVELFRKCSAEVKSGQLGGVWTLGGKLWAKN